METFFIKNVSIVYLVSIVAINKIDDAVNGCLSFTFFRLIAACSGYYFLS